MKPGKLIPLLAIILLFSPAARSEVQPFAVKGVIDLRHVADKDNFIVRLNGEWEFYWQKMLRPNDFKNQVPVSPDLFGFVPSYWTEYRNGEAAITPTGYATYRLTVLLPPDLREPLAFDMPVFDSSYDIYINGNYMGGNGLPGRSEEETKPGYLRNFFRTDPSSDTLSIIINVANFHHRRGGFWLPMKIGTFSEVQKRVAAAWAREWAIVTLLLGFSLFFLFFFIIYPKDRLMGWFSLGTTGLALRPLFTSNFLILNLMNFDWEWIIRCEYLLLYIIICGWYWFASYLYPSRFFRIVTRTVTAVFSLSALLTLFLPVTRFSYATFIVYPFLILLLAYCLTRSLRGIIKKNRVDYIYFLGFSILTFSTIHDIRVSLGKPVNPAGYILTYAIVLFVFIQAVLLLYNWIKSFAEKERLHDELEYLNRNLGNLVNERTQEIQARQLEIENQNKKIALQNRQLSETIQLKNRIFSVIAHDLRSPVVNILYMLNLLKEDEYKEKYDNFANTSIQYAQQVISLLENMLVWGRGQEDKIKYSPEKRDLADIILTNLSIFKESADNKEISVNFTQVGNSVAYFDKDLLDIIIRNLLSNAVKYTPRGGRISILLKDKTLSGEGVLLKVCDNGTGIPPLKQKHLFTSTEVESTPGTENERGTGLGLKLCSELVRINNGTISVESKEGEGTCFSITLPDPK